MKNSGIAWVGEIPKEWEVKKIKHLAYLIGGNGFSIELQGNENGDYPFCKASDISKAGKYIRSAVNYVTKKTVSEQHYNIIPKGAILFPKIGEAMKKNNRSICLCDCCTDNNCQGIVAFEERCKLFLYYVLVCIDMGWFDNAGTIPCMNNQKLLNSKIPLPSIEEQQKIAEFLDGECEKIDGLKADIQAEIETQEQYKRSVITEAVTHGLDKSAPMKDSILSWAKSIPEHWRVMPNKYLMTKIKEICPVYKGEDILSLTMNGVIVRDLDAGGKMPSSFDGYQYIKNGNLLMCLFDIDVTPRCIGIIKQDGITSPAYSQFKMKGVASARYYYYYYLMLDYTKELLPLAKNLRHSLTEEQLGSIKQLVPPLSEQEAIAEYLNQKCAEIDSAIADKKAQIETLESYKKSIIYEYVTGKKEVEL